MIQRKTLSYYLILAAFLYLSACDISKNKVEPSKEFIKIYNTDSIGVSFHALDITETLDGGFLTLAYTDDSKVFLLKTDKEGEFLWSKLFENFLNPLPSIIKIQSDLYIFSLSENFSEGTILLKVNENSQSLDFIKSFPNNLRPLFASKTNDQGILILNYDPENEKTVLLKLNSSFEEDLGFGKNGRRNYDVQMTDVFIDKLNNHVFKLDAPLPFFCGQLSQSSGSLYYFNAFIKSDLSLVFTDPVSGDAIKRMTGYQYQKCISSLTETGNNQIAFSRFEYENNILVSNQSLGEINSISSMSDFDGIPFEEVSGKSRFQSKMIDIRNEKILVFAYNTRANTIAVKAFNPLTKKLLGTKYFGHRFPHGLGNVIQTSDGGLAILAETMVTGKFRRLCLFKIGKDELESIVP